MSKLPWKQWPEEKPREAAKIIGVKDRSFFWSNIMIDLNGVYCSDTMLPLSFKWIYESELIEDAEISGVRG